MSIGGAARTSSSYAPAPAADHRMDRARPPRRGAPAAPCPRSSRRTRRARSGRRRSRRRCPTSRAPPGAGPRSSGRASSPPDSASERGRELGDQTRERARGRRRRYGSVPGAPRLPFFPTSWIAATVNVYEHEVDDWIEHRRRAAPPAIDAFAARVPPGVRADVGCGPGWHSGELGTPVVAFDAAPAMAAQVRAFAPGRVAGRRRPRTPAVPARRARPARGRTSRTCTSRPSALPMALADLHRSLRLGGALHIQVTSDRNQRERRRPLPGRHFTWWPADRLRDVVEGAGFVIDDSSTTARSGSTSRRRAPHAGRHRRAGHAGR